jgi:putative ABC transport system substrate-binding protein
VRQHAALAAKAGLPALYPTRGSVQRGGLMSYGTSWSAKWRDAALYVDRILKGAKAADLPVQQPTTFELFINRTTSAKLGIKIPQVLQLRAEFLD